MGLCVKNLFIILAERPLPPKNISLEFYLEIVYYMNDKAEYIVCCYYYVLIDIEKEATDTKCIINIRKMFSSNHLITYLINNVAIDAGDLLLLLSVFDFKKSNSYSSYYNRSGKYRENEII